MPEGKVHHFTAAGYSVEPCPGCQQTIQPGQDRAVVEGEWRVWHQACHENQDLL